MRNPNPQGSSSKGTYKTRMFVFNASLKKPDSKFSKKPDQSSEKSILDQLHGGKVGR